MLAARSKFPRHRLRKDARLSIEKTGVQIPLAGPIRESGATVARQTLNLKVGGSSPSSPAIPGVAQTARVLVSYARGWVFDAPLRDQYA
jgi:hypothetical protein